MKIIKKRNEIALINEFIKILKIEAIKKKKAKKRLSFVLTGGPSPKRLYKKMVSSRIDWSNIDLFWGDERFVSKKSINSNYKLVNDCLLKKIKINKKNIFPFKTSNIEINKAAVYYKKKIQKYFKKGQIHFDIFLLGMGNDGHIASIFPNSKELRENFITKPINRKDFKRLTLSLNLINESKKIFLWLNSKTKSSIFKKFNKADKNIPVNKLKRKKLYCFSIN